MAGIDAGRASFSRDGDTGSGGKLEIRILLQKRFTVPKRYGRTLSKTFDAAIEASTVKIAIVSIAEEGEIGFDEIELRKLRG